MTPGPTNASPGHGDGAARLFLGLALVLGCLRFLWLGEWSLWIDEAFMLADARHGGDSLKPLSYLLFDWFYAFVPGRPDEWALRMPSALMGWLCIPALYWSIVPLAGRRTAAFAALILALAPWQIYWAQNARYYTMVQLLGLLGGGALLRGLKLGSRGWCVGAGVLLLAALGTHPSAMILGFALVLAVLGCRFLSRLSVFAVGDHNRKLWWAFWGCCLLAPLFLLPHVDEVAKRWNARQSHGDPLHLVKSVAYWFTPMVCLGSLLGAWQLLRRREQLFLVILPVIGLAVALVATYFFRVAAQYTFVLFPFVAALAAVPLAAGRPKVRWQLIYGALLLAPLVLEDGLYFGLRNGDRPHWREGFAHVMEQRRPTDLVYAMEAPVGRYYWNPSNDDLRKRGSFVFLDSWSADLPQEWQRYGRRTWFIVNRDLTHDWPRADRQRLLSMLDEQCTLEAHFKVPLTPRDLDVYVYLFSPDWETQRETAADAASPGG